MTTPPATNGPQRQRRSWAVGGGGLPCTDTPSLVCRQLVAKGEWLVPALERPKGWELLGVRDPFAKSARKGVA